MTDCIDSGGIDFTPLDLKWTLPINSVEGMITVLKNVIYVLSYVQKAKCNREYVDQIIENEIHPEVSKLKDEFGFTLATIILVLCNEKSDFTNREELKNCELKIIGKFIEILEEAYKHFDDIVSFENKDISGNLIDTRPLSKQDGRQDRNIYVQYIEVILIKILSKQKNSQEPFYFTTNQLWKLLGMINNDYKNISLDNLNDRITDYEVTSFDLKKFYQRCNQRLRDILFSSLNRLEDRALIKYEIETVIVLYDDNGEKNLLPANDKQKKQILKAEKKHLKIWDLKVGNTYMQNLKR